MNKLTGNARLWVEALRSGKYPQTRHTCPYLREADGFTPIGVLCEVAKDHGVIDSYDNGQSMPLKVQKWIGFRVPLPTGINFDAGTFLEIAETLGKRAGEVFLTVRSIPFTRKQEDTLRSIAREYGASLSRLKRDAIGTNVKGQSVIVSVGKKWIEIDGEGVIT